MESRTKDVSGIPMRWQERGDGPAVVLVHGIPTSPALWRKVAPKIQGARVLAWEMVGYGESIPAGRTRDLFVASQAEYLRSWMRSLGIGRAILVGHDLGGGVVQIAAVREPSLCAGLVLTNSIGYDSWPIPAVKLMRATGGLMKRVPDWLLRLELAVLIHLGHDDRAVAEQSLEIHFAPYARHGGARALLRQMRALDNRDTLAIQAELPKLRNKPARVVWGAADPFQKLSYGERLASDLDCELTRIEGGRHFVPEDHPDVLVSAIHEVLRAAERDTHVPIAAPGP